MKSREGFVSNSSTSSFIILGIINRNISDELRERIEEGDLQDEYMVSNDDEGYVGYVLGGVGEGDTTEALLSEVLSKAEDVAADLGVNVKDLQILAWEQCS